MITEQFIREQTSSKVFSRGQSYYRSGAIIDPSKSGNTIKALCEGSQWEPYRVSAVVTENGVLSESCTCEYDWGGYCKHIVALLLTYLDEPEGFFERTPLEETLAERSKEQLIDLIKTMINRYPDLESLAERPIPNNDAMRQSPLNMQSMRYELRKGMQYFEWGDYTAANTVKSVLSTARRFADSGDWHNTSLICRTIIEEFVNEDEFAGDDEGYFFIALQDTEAELGRCLSEGNLASDETERQAIFKSLIDLYIWDIEYGGVDVSVDGTDFVLSHAQQEDIALIREQIEPYLKPKPHRYSSDWHIKIYNEFLMELDLLDNVDPEVTLQKLRDQGLYKLVFEKLIEMERIDDAVKVLEEEVQLPYERMQALVRLESTGKKDIAIRLADLWLRTAYDRRLADWLLVRYEQSGDRNGQLQQLLQTMHHDPSAIYYTKLRDVATEMGNWDTIKSEIVGKLEKEDNYEMLTRLYLAEHDWGAAWDAVSKVKRSNYYFRELEMMVAEQSRFTMPDRALPIYEKHVRLLIEARGRENYQQAAQYLTIIHELYEQLLNEEGWLLLIEGIRDEFRRLPALQDELNQAGL